MEKENEAIQKQLDCLKQAMDEEDEEVRPRSHGLCTDTQRLNP